jgi:hypothetical protein
MGNYYLAPSLVALRAELDAKWPRRDRSSDGWIGDAAHSSRASQHNPDWSSVPPGSVDALDERIRSIQLIRDALAEQFDKHGDSLIDNEDKNT